MDTDRRGRAERGHAEHTTRCFGLDYDSEAGTEENRRHVLMIHAFRRDMGID